MIVYLKKYLPFKGLLSRVRTKFLNFTDIGYWKLDVLQIYSNYNSNVKFIQIGSNTGMHGDPLCTYIKRNNWEGILVEPVPYLFENLKQHYYNFRNRLKFENSAIAKYSGIMKFYRLRKSDLHDLPIWYDQLGSFNKEVVLKHRDHVPFFDELFIEDEVNAITFDDLLKKYSVVNINLIHIDTEGYDFEILKLISFDKLNPDVIIFEHKHLNDSDHKLAIKLLKKYNFIVKKIDRVDTLGIKRTLANKLLKH